MHAPRISELLQSALAIMVLLPLVLGFFKLSKLGLRRHLATAIPAFRAALAVAAAARRNENTERTLA
jgi:hypothetical protein